MLPYFIVQLPRDSPALLFFCNAQLPPQQIPFAGALFHTLFDLLKCFALRVHIDRRSKPAYDLRFFVVNRDLTHQKPAISAVASAVHGVPTRAVRPSRMHVRMPRDSLIAVVRMNCVEPTSVLHLFQRLARVI